MPNLAQSKIIIDARMLGYSGIGRYLSELLPLLAKHQDFDFHALVTPHDKDLLPGGIKSIVTSIAPYSAQEQSKLKDLIDAQNADLVHFTHINQPFKALKTKRISTIHDLTMIDFPSKHSPSLKSQLKHSALKLGFKSMLKHNSLLLTPTQFVANQLSKRLALKAPVKITPLGGQGHLEEAITFADGEKPFLLYVGNALPHKNVGRIIDAAKSLPDYKFVLAGHDDYGYSKFTQTASNNVMFAGFVSDGKLAWLYQNATALLQPSLSEGFGLTGLEAMAYDCPVISSNATCLPEVYGNAACYFDPNSTDELIDAIRSIEPQRQQLINAGRSQVKKFSWQLCAEQTVAAYRQALVR